MLCQPADGLKIWNKIIDITSKLELNTNPEKSTEKFKTDSISNTFDFLGYNFDVQNKIISVSKKSQNKFINSLVNKIIRYKYDKKGNDPELKKKVFIEDLNERITGAIDKRRRYGWAFFFSEINDHSLLNKIDMIVLKVLKKLPDFNEDDLKKVKKVNRSYFEANHSPKRGYIHNYNEYKTLKQKIDYLSDRGLINPDGKYTEDQINKMFEQRKATNLLKLEQDTSNLS